MSDEHGGQGQSGGTSPVAAERSTKAHVQVRPGDWFRAPDGTLRRARGWCGAAGDPPERLPGGHVKWEDGETTPYTELADPGKGWARLGSTPDAALPIEAVVLLAEAAADELEVAGDASDPRVHVRSAALGLLLLAELGAAGGSGGHSREPPWVAIGDCDDPSGILADGKRRIAPREELLRRLGWARAVMKYRPCDRLLMVYVR